MKKILFSLFLVLVSITLFGCKKKTVIKTLSEALNYASKNKKETSNLKIENGSIIGLKDNGKVDGILYVGGASKIRKNAFTENSKIRSVIVGEDVKELESSSFSNLKELENIYFLGNKNLAFNSVNFNPKLTNVVFSKTELKADYNPFMNNKNLKEFTLDACINLDYKNGQLSVKTENGNKMLTMTKDFTGTFENYITTLTKYSGSMNYYDFPELKFNKGSRIKVIEELVFLDIKSLKKISLPKSIEKISKIFKAVDSPVEVVSEEGGVTLAEPDPSDQMLQSEKELYSTVAKLLGEKNDVEFNSSIIKELNNTLEALKMRNISQEDVKKFIEKLSLSTFKTFIKKGKLYKQNGTSVSMANSYLYEDVTFKTNGTLTIVSLKFSKQGLTFKFVDEDAVSKVTVGNGFDEHVFTYEGSVKKEYKISGNFMGKKDIIVILKLQ